MTNPPTNNTTLPQGPYSYNSGITSTDPFITVYSLRNPTTSDVNYPVQKRWINFNTSPPSEWILESLPVVQETQTAMWKELGGAGSGDVLGFNVPLGSSPVFPDSSGFVTYTSTGGSIAITGSTNTINWDLPGGTAAVQRFQTDDGLFETPTGTPATIIIHGTGGITTSQGTAHQININLAASGVVEKITGDDSVAVTPDSSGNINLLGLVVANGTHAKAVYTESPVAHTEKIDVQVSAAIASTDVTKVGLAAFNNTQFSVDANGFVALVGGGGAFNSINVQVFTGAGTYTYFPHANLAYAIVEVIGAGGGGGGVSSTGATTVNCTGGGGGGGYSRKVVTAAAIGSSQTVTIGGGGSGGNNTGSNGANGGTSSFGAILNASGGSYGQGNSTAYAVTQFSGGYGGVGSGGDINANGSSGESSFGIYTASGIGVNSGNGGSSFYGGGAVNRTINTSNTTQNGYNGSNYGGGGSGGAVGNSTASGAAGGNGSDGLVVVTEYIT